MSVVPFFDDGQVTLYCADFRAVEVAAGSVAAVVTSPPYNVGLDYHDGDDSLDWPAYWALAADAAGVMADALVDGGRAWVNTAVSVPAATGAGAKARVMLGVPVGPGVGGRGPVAGRSGGVVLGPGRGHGVGLVGIAGRTEPARRLGIAAGRVCGPVGEDGAAVLWGGLARHGGRLGVAVLHGLAPGPGPA